MNGLRAGMFAAPLMAAARVAAGVTSLTCQPAGPTNPAHLARIALDPLVQWVEHGIEPDRIIAYHVTNGVTDVSRPVCPYPALPRYRGVGDTTKFRVRR